jgi:hypothetical protein
MECKIIRHKGIEHGVFTDAPFVGARICAMGCRKHCPGCFNQHLVGQPCITVDVVELIKEIKDNPMNQGIILGGLEWTEQSREMQLIVFEAEKQGLQVIIYTHMDICSFLCNFPILKGHDILVKCGEYRKDSIGFWDVKYDVYIASRNQAVYNLAQR